MVNPKDNSLQDNSEYYFVRLILEDLIIKNS
jgi:hypothetical protein